MIVNETPEDTGQMDNIMGVLELSGDEVGVRCLSIRGIERVACKDFS